MTLKGWKDISGNNPSTVDGTPANAGTYEYVLFGRYPQLQGTATPVQPILWRVLGIDTGKALLFSDKNLDAMAFYPENYKAEAQLDNNYANSKVRDFLVGADANGTSGGIFNDDGAGYFSPSERGVVSPKTFTTTDGSANGAKETTNPLFLLSSTEELSKTDYGFNSKWNYYVEAAAASDVNRIARNTAYARGKGVNNNSDVGVYWTRSPYSGPGIAWYVHNGGALFNDIVISPGYAVRPACYLNLQSVIFKSASKDFDPAPPAAAAGSPENPWILVLGDMAPGGLTSKFVSADKKPAAVIHDKVLTLTWDRDVSPAVKRWPASGDFTLKPSGAHPTSVTGDGQDGKKLVLTFATGVQVGATVALDYNLNTDAISFDATTTPGTAKVVGSFSDLPVLTPPSWTTEPQTTVGLTSVDITSGALNANGTGYYIVVASGAAVPTAAQVKAGSDYGAATVLKKGSFGLTPSMTPENVTGLTHSTDYAIYFVAEANGVLQSDAAVLARTFTTGTPDKPYAAQKRPDGGQTNVALGTLIKVSFDRTVAVSKDITNTANVVLTAAGNATPIAATVTFDGARLLTISPDVALAYGTKYTVTIAADTFKRPDFPAIGNAAIAWIFTTIAQSVPGGGESGGGSTPSSNTVPSSLSITIGGEKLNAEKQADGTYLITVPNGTDVSSVDIAGKLPPGATSVPKLPAKHDFTQGPLTLVVTAEDGTKKTYTVNVIVAGPDDPTAKQYFTLNVNDCEVIATQNADGSWLVKIRLPFGAGSDPALLSAVKAYLTNLGLTDISYSWVDADGNATPVSALKASAPYLEISGTAANRDAFKNGAITSIQYMLKNDPITYVQAFANGGLKLADMPGFPQESPSGGGGSSSGCNAGFGAMAVALMAMGVVGSRKRK